MTRVYKCAACGSPNGRMGTYDGWTANLLVMAKEFSLTLREPASLYLHANCEKKLKALVDTAKQKARDAR